MKNTFTLGLLFVFVGGLSAADGLELEPLPPAESMAAAHVAEGFELQLIASEPLVRDPVAFDWRADGALWVAEMADYPLGMDDRGKPGGRVRLLTDRDGDGRYDHSTIFLDGLSFPAGIMAWRGGVLVASAPIVLFAKDTDGDGRADVRRTLFEGFFEGNHQLRINGLNWGLDNRVHGASGAVTIGYGGANNIRSGISGKSVMIRSGDFRFDPDTGWIEPTSGPSQYGRVRDDWGNWFGVHNSHPLWHYVLPARYFRRNPDVSYPDTRRQVRTPRNPRVFANKPPQKRFHSFEQSGRFTSACGPSIYRDTILFGRSGVTHAFTCEPFHNVIQRSVIREDGVSFSGERADDGERDFLRRPIGGAARFYPHRPGRCTVVCRHVPLHDRASALAAEKRAGRIAAALSQRGHLRPHLPDCAQGQTTPRGAKAGRPQAGGAGGCFVIGKRDVTGHGTPVVD